MSTIAKEVPGLPEKRVFDVLVDAIDNCVTEEDDYLRFEVEDDLLEVIKNPFERPQFIDEIKDWPTNLIGCEEFLEKLLRVCSNV